MDRGWIGISPFIQALIYVAIAAVSAYLGYLARKRRRGKDLGCRMLQGTSLKMKEAEAKSEAIIEAESSPMRSEFDRSAGIDATNSNAWRGAYFEGRVARQEV